MTLNIDTSNAAFKDPHCRFGADCSTDGCATCRAAEQAEVARILTVVIGHLAAGRRRGACPDVNGNLVGAWSL